MTRRATLVVATVVVVVVVIVMLPAAALAQTDPAEVLYYEGNPSAAAAIFEQRFADTKTPKNGMRAVRAWKEAGRYARARKLLATVAQEARDDAALAPHVVALETQLTRLTVLATLAGDRLAADAIVTVDGQPPEWIDDRLILPIGEHAVAIEQPLCERFTWQGLVVPEEAVNIGVRLACAREGTLHLTLVGTRHDPTRTIFVDGKPYSTTADANLHELDVKLAPGRHDLRIESNGRLVVAESFEIVANRTVTRRVRYPWRAQGLQFGVRASGSAAGSREARIAAAGLGAGMDGRWAAIFLDLGRGVAREGSGMWLGAEFAFHVFKRPLWYAHSPRMLATFDIDPLGFHADMHARDIEGTSHTRTTYSLGFVPLRLTVEWIPIQVQLTVWPLCYAGTTTTDGLNPMSRGALGFSTTLSIGWHR